MRPSGGALAAVAALAVVVGGASLIGPPESVVEEHPEVLEPVVRTSLVCPFAGGEPVGDSEIGVLALPDVGEQPAEGAAPATVTALASMPEPDPEATEPAEEPTEEPTEEPEPATEELPAVEPILSTASRGVPAYIGVDAEDPASYAVEGIDAMAPGLVAEQSLLVESSDLHGLSTSSCGAAGREHWFVGGSGEVGRRGRLILANPTDVPAVVDIALWDEAGPIDAPATQDISVAAGSQRVLLLDALAPGSVQVAVRVTTSQGRVSAALEMRESAEITPQGMSFVPAAVAPANRVMVPAVPAVGERLLRIVAPGDVDAIVAMRIYGPDGAFSPVDQEVLTVTAGSVLEVPITPGNNAVAVELESDEPITAGLRVVDSPEDAAPDIAYTAATPALTGPAAALLSRVGSNLASTLLLSAADDTGGRATVRLLGPDGAVVTETPIEVPGGTMVPVPLAVPEGATWATAVVVPETPNTILVGRSMTGAGENGALVDVLPMTSAPFEVPVPDVVGELPEVPDPGETD